MKTKSFEEIGKEADSLFNKAMKEGEKIFNKVVTETVKASVKSNSPFVEKEKEEKEKGACPFCGKKNGHVVGNNGTGGRWYCEGCGAMGPSSDDPHKAWYNRV